MLQAGAVSALLAVILTVAGIVLPATATVMALRRRVVAVSWRHTVLFLGLTLSFLHGAVFTSRLPVPDFARVVDVGHPIIDFLNVRFLITDPDATAQTFPEGMGPNWQLVYRGTDAALFENQHVMARFFTPRQVVASHGGGLSEQLRTIKDFRESAIVDGWRGQDRNMQFFEKCIARNS